MIGDRRIFFAQFLQRSNLLNQLVTLDLKDSRIVRALNDEKWPDNVLGVKQG